MVALAVELAINRECMPSLEVLGDGLVEQRTFGVAQVIELGFGTRLPTRKRMRVGLRRRRGEGHGAVPAGAECLMILGLYPALSRAKPITVIVILRWAEYDRPTIWRPYDL